MQYITTINTPGFLPDPDDFAVFDTPKEAWEYLLDEYVTAWNETSYVGDDDPPPPALKAAYDQGVATLTAWTVAPQGGFPGADWTGTAYVPTAGYVGDHDLGKAYSVTAREGVTCVDCGSAFTDDATAQAHWDEVHDR